MKFLKRISEITRRDLHRFQAAILREIRHRRHLSETETTADDGPVIAGRIVPSRKAAPAKAKPARTRRAA